MLVTHQTPSLGLAPANLDSDGNLKVNVAAGGGAGGTSSTFGAPIPSAGTAAGFQDVSGDMAPGNLDALGQLKVAGTFSSTPATAGTSVLSNVPGSGSSVTVLAANAARLGFTLYNDSDSPVNVKLGATASSTSFTRRLLPQDVVSTQDLGINYTGKIDAIWDSATGAMRVTELSA